MLRWQRNLEFVTWENEIEENWIKIWNNTYDTSNITDVDKFVIDIRADSYCNDLYSRLVDTRLHNDLR